MIKNRNFWPLIISLCNLDRYQILQLYMAVGGIPQYLSTVQKGDSASQSIEKICFKKNGLLNGEFDNIYNSLFEMAGAPKGLTRSEIIEKCGLSSGGRTTVMLDELEQSGFIKSSKIYDKEYYIWRKGEWSDANAGQKKSHNGRPFYLIFVFQ